MSSEEIDKLEGRALDHRIAEVVFGRDRMNARVGLHENGDLEYYWGYPVGHDIAPRYSTDIAADNDVLKHVRENWNESQQWRFIHAIADILRIRDTEWTTFGTLYLVMFGNGHAKGLQVGDYARAALKASLAPAEKGEKA